MGPGSPAAERVAGTPGRFSHAGRALRTALSVRRRRKDSGLQGLRGGAVLAQRLLTRA